MATRVTVFPAYAGVILTIKEACKQLGSVPRVCGGDPYLKTSQRRLIKCSPRMRG